MHQRYGQDKIVHFSVTNLPEKSLSSVIGQLQISKERYALRQQALKPEFQNASDAFKK
jgi:hypothetical protein